MKLKEIAARYGINRKNFEEFCATCPVIKLTGNALDEIQNDKVEEAVKLFSLPPLERNKYISELAEKQRMEKEELARKEMAARRSALGWRGAELDKIDAFCAQIKDEMENRWLFNLEGSRGRRIRVFPNKAIINTDVTIGSVVTGNATDGEKTIYFKDVIGVQFKKPGLSLGYLQLETATGTMNNKASNFFNENTFTFEQNIEEATQIYYYIIGRLDQLKKF